MDKSMNDCYRVLDLFLPLIDRANDKIYGFTLMPHFAQNDDDVKEKFYEKMKELNFKENEQFQYSSKLYNNSPINILVDFVNHNSEQFFDFVIFLNNPMKFKTQKQECDTFKYVKLLYANIGFCNYAFIHGYDYKVLSKLPNEIDSRAYLDKINKPESKEVKEALNTLLPKISTESIEQEIERILTDENKENIQINKKEEDDKEKEDEEIYSEIFGVNKGNVFERISPTKPKSNIKKEEFKIEPKNLEKVNRDFKKKKTWAPTSTSSKRVSGVMKAAVEATKKVNKANYGTNKTSKMNKTSKVTKKK